MDTKLNEIFDAPAAIFDTRDPFRLKVQKCLTAALAQVTSDKSHLVAAYGQKVDDEGNPVVDDEGNPVPAVKPFRTDLRPEDIPDDPLGRTLARANRGRRYYGSEDPLPLVAILEEPFSFEQDLAPAVGRIRTEPYELILQGFVQDDADHPTDPAHVLLADVKRRLVALKADEDLQRQRIFRIGNRDNSVVSLTFDGGVVRPADEVSAVAHFWLRVSLEVSEDYEKPQSWWGSSPS